MLVFDLHYISEARTSGGEMQVAGFVFDSPVGVILYFERRSVLKAWAMDASNFLFAFGPRGHTLGGTP